MAEFLTYVLRSLLSEGRVVYETVEKTPDGLQARRIERDGPTGLMMTTTATSLDPELETRTLVLTATDTPVQTRRIFRAIAAQHSGGAQQEPAVDMDEWHAFQEWLGLANHTVIIPYASAIAELLAPIAVRLRRDFDCVLVLTEAHAILHQANRKLDHRGRIIALLRDYEAVRDLISPVISQGVEQTVSKTIRQTVEAVGRICTKKEEGERHIPDQPATATIKETAKKLGLDRSAASRRINKALHGGYLKNLETKRGQPKQLVIGDPLPEEGSILPTPEEVKVQWKKMRQPS